MYTFYGRIWLNRPNLDNLKLISYQTCDLQTVSIILTGIYIKFSDLITIHSVPEIPEKCTRTARG